MSIDDATPAEWDAAYRAARAASPLDDQVGGSHYMRGGIQPIEFITSNDVPFREANVIKYVFRHAQKNGVEDLKKARHYLDMLISDYKGDNL